jgi:hypothetical protein
VAVPMRGEGYYVHEVWYGGGLRGRGGVHLGEGVLPWVVHYWVAFRCAPCTPLSLDTTAID